MTHSDTSVGSFFLRFPRGSAGQNSCEAAASKPNFAGRFTLVKVTPTKDFTTNNVSGSYSHENTGPEGDRPL